MIQPFSGWPQADKIAFHKEVRRVQGDLHPIPLKGVKKTITIPSIIGGSAERICLFTPHGVQDSATGLSLRSS